MQGQQHRSNSGNFAFLAEHDPVFLDLSSSAEHAFAHDPNTTLIKLRQLGEAMAQDIAVSIVGHSRRAALGEALIPFEQRVRDAMRRIYALHAWDTQPAQVARSPGQAADSRSGARPSLNQPSASLIMVA